MNSHVLLYKNAGVRIVRIRVGRCDRGVAVDWVKGGWMEEWIGFGLVGDGWMNKWMDWMGPAS